MRHKSGCWEWAINHQTSSGDVSSHHCPRWILFTGVPLIYFSRWVRKSLSWRTNCMSSKFHGPGDRLVHLLDFNSNKKPVWRKLSRAPRWKRNYFRLDSFVSCVFLFLLNELLYDNFFHHDVLRNAETSSWWDLTCQLVHPSPGMTWLLPAIMLWTSYFSVILSLKLNMPLETL